MKAHSQYLKVLSLTFSILKNAVLGYRDNLAIKNFYCRIFKFGSQHPCDGSQASVTADLGVQCFPLTSQGTRHSCGTYIFIYIYAGKSITSIK